MFDKFHTENSKLRDTKNGVNSAVPEGWIIPAPLVAQVILLLNDTKLDMSIIYIPL
jgi:hypothetical protein